MAGIGAMAWPLGAPPQQLATSVISDRPELITFTSGDLALKGFIWKPEGPGPFPAILWNHGSEKLPGAVDSVASYFNFFRDMR